MVINVNRKYFWIMFDLNATIMNKSFITEEDSIIYLNYSIPI